MPFSHLKRMSISLKPDASRVVVRPFRPATEPRDLHPAEKSRANRIVDRVLGMGEAEVEQMLAEVFESFEGRHRRLREAFAARADEMEEALVAHEPFTPSQRLLVGAYFLHEYSFEASALFNPSIVVHPDQRELPEGALRFILTLRAVGEGHVSSLTFRSGVVMADGAVTIDLKARLATIPRVTGREWGPEGETVHLSFDAVDDMSERVIFPVTERQSNGIEDARFVAFTDDDGRRSYFGTYTAYDGRSIRSELCMTEDFVHLTMAPIAGNAARNKGLALFPRRIDGRYAMIGRMDNENLYYLQSDTVTRWEGGTMIVEPTFPWEFVQIGNCGSPVEVDEGWLLLTHGVGPVRRYALGAVLLDRDDPSKVLARTVQPILRPQPGEREGYVPNVVYTCGAIRHRDMLVLPYAVSDTHTNIAVIPLAQLMAAMA